MVSNAMKKDITPGEVVAAGIGSGLGKKSGLSH
jgi:hypothetical protein